MPFTCFLKFPLEEAAIFLRIPDSRVNQLGWGWGWREREGEQGRSNGPKAQFLCWSVLLPGMQDNKISAATDKNSVAGILHSVVSILFPYYS